MRPPICLRYAIWATAAALTDKYENYEDIFYKRARKYVEAAEMKVGGDTVLARTLLTPHRAMERRL